MTADAFRLPPSFARPERICGRVAALVAEQAKRLTNRAWRGEARPSDGAAIVFRFTADGDKVLELSWIAENGRTLEKVPGAFSFTRVDEPGSEGPLLAALGLILAGVARHPELAFLSPALGPASAAPLPWPASFAAFLPGAKLGWFDYTLERLETLGTRVLLHFTNGQRQVALGLEPNREDAPQNAELLWVGRYFRLVRTQDTRRDDEKRELSHAVEQAALFFAERFERRLGPPSAAAEGQGKPTFDILPFLLPMTAEAGDKQRLRLMRNSFSAFEGAWNLHAESLIRDSPLIEDIDQSQDIWIVVVLHASCIYTNYPFDVFGPGIRYFHRGLDTRPHLAKSTAGLLHGGIYVDERHFITDGGLNDWKAFLKRLDREAGPDTLIVSYETCYNKLMGYTLAEPNRNHHLDLKAPCTTAHPGAVMPRGHEQPVAAAFEAFLRLAEPCARSEGPTLNLIGFPERRDSDELIEELRRLGIEVNSRLVPQARGAEARRFNAAWGQYWLPWKPFFPEVFGPLPVPQIESAPPAGPQGTLAWLRTVALALGQEAAFARYLAERGPTLKEERAALRAKTAALTLGFIADLTTLSRLWDPWRMVGFSLLPFVLDLGFGLAVYYHGSETELAQARAYLATLHPEASAAAGLRFFTFESPEDFDTLLREGPAQVFFSDCELAPAIANAGRATFSMDDLERGFQGATRSAERLLRRLSPYRARFGVLNAPLPPTQAAQPGEDTP